MFRRDGNTNQVVNLRTKNVIKANKIKTNLLNFFFFMNVNLIYLILCCCITYLFYLHWKCKQLESNIISVNSSYGYQKIDK